MTREERELREQERERRRQQREQDADRLEQLCAEVSLRADAVNPYLESVGSNCIPTR